MPQIEFTEQSELPASGRIRSRILHSPAVSYIKLMYLVNLLFIAGWTVLACLVIIQPEQDRVPLPYWMVCTLTVFGYLVAFSVIFSLKFGKLRLMLAARTYYRVLCIIIVLAVVLGMHYTDYRKDFLLIVLGYLYLYQ